MQGYALYRLAREGEGAGAIVEIGSWQGRSTAWLAAGSQARNREHVYAVDTFDGGPALKAEDYPILKDQGTTYHLFAENLERVGVIDHVEPMMCDSVTAAKRWDGRAIRLLFIDGDHSYQAVKADLEAWLPYVIGGGYVVFDDVGEAYPGVQRVLREATAHGGPLERVFAISKMSVTRRRAA
jgi:predicted O-methyltransferase YrrM